MAFAASILSDDLLVILASLREAGYPSVRLIADVQASSIIKLDGLTTVGGVDPATATAANATCTGSGTITLPIVALYNLVWQLPEGATVAMTGVPAVAPHPAKLTLGWTPQGGSAHSWTVPVEGLSTGA